MCTIHIAKCPDCNHITSLTRHPCASTPRARLCHNNLTNTVTTYLLPGRCDACLTRTGPYHALPPSAAATPHALQSSFESLSSTLGQHYAARLRMVRRKLASGAGRFFGSGGRRESTRDGEAGRGRRFHLWRWTVEISQRESKRGF
ncbi:hypothetical protein CkaCkLH20_07424 [Colletotrichum karsti]|uniref:Uncharacterized protein n=1 Tax=Colletotrichum karsti TaxID=1095194 RepID=A0A9P6LIZ3_9PEZI|nr:uncharacterized protein CkaCkLH20_07424 [Colletotrichum karsti]KAF9875158.1 hypothetical protein CkaCkLH20_07424 [Colletotrichum karsti]